MPITKWQVARSRCSPVFIVALGCDLAEHLEPIAYVFGVLTGGALELQGAWTDAGPQAALHIIYAQQRPTGTDGPTVWIRADDRLWRNYGTAASLPPAGLKLLEGVPILYGGSDAEQTGSRLEVASDIVASAYFLLTRYEEVVRREVRDEHGRFPGRESFPYKNGFIERPVVDEYADLLRSWAARVGVDWPRPHRRFSVLATHDVDSLRKYPRRHWALGDALQGPFLSGRLLSALGVGLGLMRDPYDTFADLLAIDRLPAPVCPTQSVYFFLSGSLSQQAGPYDVRARVVRKTLRQVTEQGAAVGYHTSYEAGLHPERIQTEKTALEEACGFPIRRNRHHYLAWREVEDGWFLVRAGLDWDSSLGYADVSGFRLGVCHPIPLYDPVGLKPFGIEEHPLIVMDNTLSAAKYMNLGEEDAFDLCRRLIRQTQKHNGEWVMLWHNHMFDRSRANYHPTLYPRLLSELAGRSELDAPACGLT